MQHQRIFQYWLIFIILTTASFVWAGVRGDVNGDGKLGLDDTIYTLQVVAGMKPPHTDVVHSGTILADETWYARDNPHIVSGILYVAGSAPEGATLTIEPGVEVRFDEDASLVIGYTEKPGMLKAVGTESDRITFTSNQDKKIAGYWDCIRFNAQDSGSVMKYCTVEYGGNNVQFGNIYVNGAKNLTISNCRIANSLNVGVRVYDDTGFVNFINNTITDNATYGIELYPDQVRGIAADNKVSGNGTDGEAPGIKLHYTNTYVTNDATWHKLDAPYLAPSGFNVVDENSVTLTIEAGTEIRFGPGSFISVGGGGSGKLVAIGEKDDLIIFT